MSDRVSGNTANGAAAFKLSPPPGVPREVQASFVLWLTAVAPGVVETIIRVIYSFSVGSGSGGGDGANSGGLKGGGSSGVGLNITRGVAGE